MSFLRHPEKFTRLGGKMTKGVLLMGPPGTGKTLLAKAIAGEAGVPFFYASGSEFEEMYVGVGARRVRELFENAKKKAPCIIFIDEIDAIGGTRNPKDQQYMRMTLNQLLAEMDGFNSAQGIVVIAATNFPEVLDKALTRPGRLDRHVVVPNPDVKGRTQILQLHLQQVPVSPDVKIEVVARGTPGMSGADLANLVNVAAITASNQSKKAVDMSDLEFAKDRIMMGAERKSAVVTEVHRFPSSLPPLTSTYTPRSIFCVLRLTMDELNLQLSLSSLLFLNTSISRSLAPRLAPPLPSLLPSSLAFSLYKSLPPPPSLLARSLALSLTLSPSLTPLPSRAPSLTLFHPHSLVPKLARFLASSLACSLPHLLARSFARSLPRPPFLPSTLSPCLPLCCSCMVGRQQSRLASLYLSAHKFLHSVSTHYRRAGS